MSGSRSVVLVGALALVLVTAIGVRHVVLEGRAVEEALRAGQRLRLEAQAGRLGAAVLAAETSALALLDRSWRDAADLEAAVRGAQERAPVPAGCWFVVGDAGEILYPPAAPLLGPVEGREQADDATAVLQAAEGLAREGRPEDALAGYADFLARFPGPAPEPQMRPLARWRMAELHAGLDRNAAAARALVELEEEFAAQTARADAALVALYRTRSDRLLVDLGAAALDVRPSLDAARQATERRLASARFRDDLRGWLAARVHLEVASGGGQGTGGTRFAVSVSGESRRFVLRAKQLAGRAVTVGYESDLERVTRELLRPRLARDAAAADAEDVRFALVEEQGARDPASVGLGPDLPALRLALDTSHGDPAARAARSRQWLLGALLAGVLLLAVSAALLTLRHAARRLELARLRSDFVSGVSHELRTPLTVIQAVVETLQLGHVRDETERQEYLQMVARECRRLSALIGNVLDFARGERGDTRYVVADAEVGPLLETLCDTHRPVLASRGLELELDVEESLPAVRADPEALSRAVANLLDNAAKYAPGSETIAVRARRSGERVSIAVADRGPGIAPVDLPHIFEPFRRGRDVHERQVRGAGLGLALVRQTMDGMGGRVEVASRAGEGATFELLLQPASEAAS